VLGVVSFSYSIPTAITQTSKYSNSTSNNNCVLGGSVFLRLNPQQQKPPTSKYYKINCVSADFLILNLKSNNTKLKLPEQQQLSPTRSTASSCAVHRPFLRLKTTVTSNVLVIFKLTLNLDFLKFIQILKAKIMGGIYCIDTSHIERYSSKTFALYILNISVKF